MSAALDPLQVARDLLAGMTDAALLLDSRLEPLSYNASYAAMTGLKPRALKKELSGGADPLELIGGSAELDRLHADECLTRKKSIRLAEVPVRNAAGKELTVHLTYLPVLDGDGRPVGILQVYRDVSDEVRIQERYKEMLAIERARAADLERLVEQRTQELTAALEEVTRLSRTDPLTNLLNRRAFTEHAEQAFQLARRHGRHVGILMCDLDHFKRLNDTWGHQSGDAVLVATAKALLGAVRTSDKAARFGGEEFIVLLTDTASESIEAVGARCRQMVRTLPMAELIPGASFMQTVSVGLALFPQHGASLEEVVARADEALYHAKRSGRDRVVLFDPSIQEAEPPAEHRQDAVAPARLLLVDDDPGRSERVREALASSYAVVSARTTAEALTLCQRDVFDAMVVDQAVDGAGGIEVLRRSLRHRPDALRVLLVERKDAFMELRGASVALIDCFVLRDDVRSHLEAAIADGLVRRELTRQKLVDSSPAIHHSYGQQIDDLERIIAERALRFAYQPMVDAHTGQVCAYEALCRVDHRYFCDPTVLFDAAVQSGNIWRLGRLVREMAAAPLARLPEEISLFVNLHPAEIDDPTLTERILAEPWAKRLVFEITERGTISDLGRFNENTRLMRERGHRFAIDDLGAGYASLNSVALLDPDFIKIDMTIVRGIHLSPRKAHLVRRIVEFANDEGIRVIAEGIENAEEAARVIEIGCHLLQGYHFGHPAQLPPSQP